ncbi:hypothetical protein [Massilia sp. CCM 8734]|uniref:hypothetical protein n=1 Tax=Massilia sp. CCM 8734 TaxID=2609283 RepID=UPI00141E521A|nr:hypothetical protein [Massilia sp. CCM 8734]NIA00881.1 hypothetical protein [Massilia sp. CCM 8734]
MAIQIPPTITPVPTPAIQRGDRTTFSSRVDAFVNWLVAGASQFGAVATNVYNNAVDAAASATSALSNRGLTQAAADAAESYRTQAKNSADAAAASATTIGTTAAFSDANPVVKGSADITKQLKFEVDGFTTGTTRTVTIPNKSGTLAMLEDTGMRLIGGPYTPAATATLDFASIFTGEWDWVECFMHDIMPLANGESLFMRFFVGGVINTSTVYGTVVDNNNNAMALSNVSLATTVSGSSTVATYPHTGLSTRICIRNINSATRMKTGESNALFVGGGGQSGGVYNERKNFGFTGGAITGLRFFWSGGTTFLPQGTVRFYGYKNA